MKNLRIETNVQVFEKVEELSKEDQELLQTAHQYVNHAYAPYSNFCVGAAVRLENNAIIGGSNMENAAYPICVCAEPATLAAAASQHPNVPIKAIAITVKHPEKPVLTPAAPCGSCRQVLSEAEDKYGQKIAIILQGESGIIYKVSSAKDLLPLSFSGDFL
jgi:cytidine deaminase